MVQAMPNATSSHSRRGAAAASLARELEVIADHAAACELGDRQVVARALARAALGTTGVPSAPSPAMAFGGERDLRSAR